MFDAKLFPLKNYPWNGIISTHSPLTAINFHSTSLHKYVNQLLNIINYLSIYLLQILVIQITNYVRMTVS